LKQELRVALSTEEEESIEAIKKWWNETGKSLAIGVVAAAALFLGWQQWQNAGVRTAAEASAIYEQLTTLAATQPGAVIGEEESAQARSLIQNLKAEHNDSVYALYAALFGASIAVDANDLETAEQELRWLLDNRQTGFFNKTDESLVIAAQLRLARVLFAKGEAQQALELIASVDPKGFAAEFAELRGDIFMSQGQTREAQTAWQEAAQLDSGSPALQMKLNNLPIGS
jgi:predicted negative regulator of RcsB-dependent stress response